jgi:hypothetical protein
MKLLIGKLGISLIKNMVTFTKKYIFLVAILCVVLIQISCGTMQIIIQDRSAYINDIPHLSPTSTPVESEESTINPTEYSTSPTPTPSTPWFSPVISFSLEPDPQKTQRVFPSGIQQIFAIWDYANMKDGLVIRKEWYKDEDLIQAQESKWDFQRYGSKGTISDISINDFESGLNPGLYSLRLYIDGQEQTLTTLKGQASFRIVREISPSPVTAPDGSKIAMVPEPRTLSIQNENGVIAQVFKGQEIARLAWFPDSQNIIVSNRDRSKQDLSGNTEGAREELWIINTESGLRSRIATPEENLHMPLISPNGHFVAAVSGSGRLNACEADLSVVLIELDNNLSRVAIHNLFDFVGLPEYKYLPIPINHPSVPLPGNWLGDSQFSVALKFPCSSGVSDGVYLFNLETWQVELLH